MNILSGFFLLIPSTTGPTGMCVQCVCVGGGCPGPGDGWVGVGGGGK